MRFDLTDLRLFLNVVESGSITHGAAVSAMSLAAASERLSGMEAAGGLRLLDRNRRGVTPTQAGEALLGHARLILRQIAQMQGELGAWTDRPAAVIRLHVNTAAMTELLPPLLGPWLAEHPNVSIDLRERQSSDTVAAVRNGLAQIGIISDAVEAVGLVLHPFAIDRLVVVAPRDDAVAGRKQVALADLLDRHFVALDHGSALQTHIEARSPPMRIRVRLHTFEAIAQMVAAGVGIAVMPESAARRSRLARVRLAETWATRRLLLCHGHDLPEPAKSLVRHLSRQ